MLWWWKQQLGFVMLQQNFSSFLVHGIDLKFKNETSMNSSVEIYSVPWNDITIKYKNFNTSLICSTWPCVINESLYLVKSKQTQLNYTMKLSNDSYFWFRIFVFDDKSSYDNFRSNRNRMYYYPLKTKIFNGSFSKPVSLLLSDNDMKQLAAYYYTVIHFAYPPDYLDNVNNTGVQIEVNLNASVGYYSIPSNNTPIFRANNENKGKRLHVHNDNSLLAKFKSCTNGSAVTDIEIQSGNIIKAPLGIIAISLLSILVIIILAASALLILCSKRKKISKSFRESFSNSMPTYAEDKTPNIQYRAQTNRLNQSDCDSVRSFSPDINPDHQGDN